MRIRTLLGTFLPLVALAGVAVGSGAGAAALREDDASSPASPYSLSADGAPSVPPGAWVPDLSSREGRMVAAGQSAGALPLPLREPGLSAFEAAEILRLALTAPNAAAQADPPGTPGPANDGLGLSDYLQYAGTDAGPGTAVEVNQADGNGLVTLAPSDLPGRGLASFVRLTYNSMDPTSSPIGYGWTLSASTVVPVGQYLRQLPDPERGQGGRTVSGPDTGADVRHDLGQPIGPGMPTRVEYVDAGGAGHVFTLDKHGSPDPREWDYLTPPALHLYLQRTGSTDPGRAWELTRPDRTQFFFGRDGVPSSIVDRVGNTLSYRYAEPAGTPSRHLLAVVDASGRQTLTLNYLGQTGDASGKQVVVPGGGGARLAAITDLTGRRLLFGYDPAGRLVSFTEAAGSPVARSFRFGYALRDSRVTSVADPLGHTTSLSYFPDSGDALHRGRVSSLTNRDGGVTGFDYQPAPTGGPGVTDSTIVDPDGHRTVLALDSAGRAVRSTNALGQTTDAAWDADDNVVRMREADGAVSTWVYDPVTGYPLTIADAVANATAGPGQAPAAVALTYRTSLGGHIADLVSKVSAEGRRWAFALDGYGQPTGVTDPVGNMAGPDSGEHTSMRYDKYGELIESVDDAGHATRFADFTAAGYPQSTTDPLGLVTHNTFDALGELTSVTAPPDPNQPARLATYTYDELGRPLVSTKVSAPGHVIVTQAPIYDADDDLLKSFDALKIATSYQYDPMGRPLSRTAPAVGVTPSGSPDSSVLPVTTFSYDADGNTLTQTDPDGNGPGAAQGSYTARFVYDPLGEVVQATDPAGGRTTYGYDSVGDQIWQVGPRGNASPNPSAWKQTTTYDADREPVKLTDDTGAYTASRYDLDGVVTDTTSRQVAANVPDTDSALHRYFTHTTYDANGRVLQIDAPYNDSAGPLVYHSIRYVYDRDGDPVETISPRGVASGHLDTFVTRTVFDADQHAIEQDEPYDPADHTYHDPDPTYYKYDAIGDVSQVSAPPSGTGKTRLVTDNAYAADGQLISSTDPWDLQTSYTYDDDGRQLTRTVQNLAENDLASAQRTVSWVYNDDGSTRAEDDSGAPAGGDLAAVDDGDPNITQPSGAWHEASAGSNYSGSGYDVHDAGDGSDHYSWSIQVPTTGQYRIDVRVPSGTGIAGLSPDPHYTVQRDGQVDTVQPGKPDSAGWAALGTYALTQDHAVSLDLAQSTDGAVIADAVRIVRTDTPTKTDPKAKAFSYKYDLDGNLIEQDDASLDSPVGSYSAEYDVLGRLSRVTPSNTSQPTSLYSYDPDSDVTQRTYANRVDTFTYDQRDQLSTSVETLPGGPGPITTRFTHYPDGSLQHEVEGNGDTLDADYYLDGSLSKQVEKKAGGALVDQRTLTYDPDGDRLTENDRTMNADDHAAYLTDDQTFTYDPRDRIEHVARSGGPDLTPEDYTHDPENNVTAQTVDKVHTGFTFDRNRLISSTAEAPDAPTQTTDYEYDSLGRLSTAVDASGHAKQRVLERHSYDGFDDQTQTVSTSLDGSSTSTTDFGYDSLGRLTSTTDHLTGAGAPSGPGSGPNPAVTDHQYLGLTGTVVADVTHGGASSDYYYDSDGTRLAQYRKPSTGSAQTSYYGYDEHADVTLLTDEHGDTRATYGYTSYGADDPAQFSGPDKPTDPRPGADPNGGTDPANAFRFNGARFDQGSGQYDMGFRDYSPGLDSFVSRDSYQGALADLNLGSDPFTMNQYAFGGGNPLSEIEFDGHGWFDSLVETVASTVVSIAVGVGCEAATAGAGSIGCAAAAGAAGALVDQGFKCGEQGGSACSVGAFAGSAVKGAVTGAAFGGLAKLGKAAEDTAGALDSAGSDAGDAAPKGEPATGAKPHENSPSSTSDSAAHQEPNTDQSVGHGDDLESSPEKQEPGCNSFVPGTRVLMGDGTAEPIQDVRVGDEVRNAVPGAPGEQTHPVSAVHVTLTDRDFADIAVAGPRGAGTITSTAGHLFYDLTTARWTPASQLAPGDDLQGVDGADIEVLSVRRHTAAVVTYNLGVDEVHTFYVEAGGTPVLVHNTDPSSCDLPSEFDRLQQRAQTVHEQLDPIAQGHQDTVAMSTEEGTDVIAGGVRDIRPVQRPLEPGEMEARMGGQHAEPTAVFRAQQAGLTPKAIVSHPLPFCPACRQYLEEEGFRIVDPYSAYMRDFEGS